MAGRYMTPPLVVGVPVPGADPVLVEDGHVLAGRVVSPASFYGADDRAASIVITPDGRRTHNVVVTDVGSLSVLRALSLGDLVIVSGTILDWGQACGAEYWGAVSRPDRQEF